MPHGNDDNRRTTRHVSAAFHSIAKFSLGVLIFISAKGTKGLGSAVQIKSIPMLLKVSVSIHFYRAFVTLFRALDMHGLFSNNTPFPKMHRLKDLVGSP